MANNYCQGSQSWEFDDPKHRAWFEHQLDTVEVFWDDTDSIGWRQLTDQDRFNTEIYDAKLDKFNVDMIEIPRFRLDDLNLYEQNDDDSMSSCEFEYEISDKEIWFFGEEYINLEPVADLMHKFFKEHELHETYFYMSTASTCSKLRVEEFGGGACFVTSDGIDSFGTYSWIQEKIREFENKAKGI